MAARRHDLSAASRTAEAPRPVGKKDRPSRCIQRGISVNLRTVSAAAVCLSACVLVPGCHSYRIDVVVENRTGAALDLLEVDYPSASFGADKLASGADY